MILNSFPDTEFLSSLQSDLSLLPLIFSLLSLCRLSDRLVSRIVSDVIDPSIKKEQNKTPLHSLNLVLESITKVRTLTTMVNNSLNYLNHYFIINLASIGLVISIGISFEGSIDRLPRSISTHFPTLLYR